MSEIFIEKCTRIIKKEGEDTLNFFLTPNAFSGHITIEDGFNHLCPIDLEAIPDLISELTKMHAETVEAHKKHTAQHQAWMEKVKADEKNVTPETNN
jgi:alkyl hydroperoxide reductase subunit AhpC